MRGGGGIVPDLVIRPDSLTSGEREFARELGGHIPQYRDALTAFALDAKKSGSIKSEDFKVTPEMRQQLLQKLKAKSVDLSPEAFDSASRLINDQLGYEIARYVFGRPAEFRRKARDDEQMQAAIELLRKAQSPKELMSLATSSRAGAPAQN